MAESGQEQLVQPKPLDIQYAKDFETPKHPYKVEVDPQGLRELLLATGVKPEKLDTLKIRIKTNQSLVSKLYGDAMAEYDDKANTIIMYTEPFWKYAYKEPLKEKQQALDSIHSGNADIGTDAPFYNLKTSRFSWYAKVASPERAQKTLERLQNIALNRDLNTGLAHEASHASDESVGFIERTKSLNKSGYLKKLIKYFGPQQGILFLINNFHLIDSNSMEGIAISVGSGLAAGGLTVIDYFRSYGIPAFEKDEEKAYTHMDEVEGKWKVITMTPGIKPQ